VKDSADTGNKRLRRAQRAYPENSGVRWFATQIFGLARQYGGTLIWAFVVVYLVKVVGETAQAFAGKSSNANFIVNLAAQMNVTVAISIVLTGVTSLMWILEHRRHRQTRERLTGRITELEKLLDPHRESSNLTTQGTTRIGDQ
jgi:hypothetical protein